MKAIHPNIESKKAKDKVEEMPGILSPSEDDQDKLMNSIWSSVGFSLLILFLH